MIHDSISPKSTFQFMPRKDSLTDWDEKLYLMEYAPVFYTNEAIDYQLEYYYDKKKLIDESIIIYYDNKFFGFFILFFDIEENSYFDPFTGSTGIRTPLVNKNKYSLKLIKDLCLALIHKIKLNILNYQIPEITFKIDFMMEYYLPTWLDAIKNNFKVKSISDFETFYVDLRLSKEQILSHYNKGLKYDLKRGWDNFKLRVYYSCDKNIWKEFREMHLRVAGKLTRSAESWEMQLKMLNNGNGILIQIKDFQEKTLGFSFFQFTKSEMEYSVAAYDREYFDKPISHIGIFEAILQAQKLNIKYLRLGPKLYSYGLHTLKEINISNFKKKFSTNSVISLNYNMEI